MRHSPFVIHLKPAITQLAREYQARGVKVLAISSNSVQTHPQDGPGAPPLLQLALLLPAARACKLLHARAQQQLARAGGGGGCVVFRRPDAP